MARISLFVYYSFLYIFDGRFLGVLTQFAFDDKKIISRLTPLMIIVQPSHLIYVLFEMYCEN